jgi:long-chain acyl-CoA synthetase
MAQSNVLNQFLHWEKNAPAHVFLRQPVDGQWKTWTFSQAGDEIRRVASALQQLPPKSNIAILSKNCAHWLMADLAIIMAGHVSVPLYANNTSHSIKLILEHSGSKAIFIGKLDDYAEQKQGIPPDLLKISFDFYGANEGSSWSRWLNDFPRMESFVHRGPEELVTIMYTSGTTGSPKGVMFNSKAFDYTTHRLIDYLSKHEPLPKHPRLFSYLPLCHIAEKNLTENLACYSGASVSFVESLDTFARDLAATNPHLFFGVPRIWAKFQEKILEKLPQQKLDNLLRIPLVSSVVKKSIQKKLGLHKARLKGTGAAPMLVNLLTWFDSLGIRIREIYGMTENCALSHSNQGEVRFGTVGQAMPGVDVKLAEENEIWTRHEALMMGYYKEPQLTAEVLTPDGFLKTGDQGEIDKDGYLTITGRLKDLFKTDKGKYIAPAPIEMRLLRCPDIDQACVVGMSLPQPIALLVLSAQGKSKSQEEIKMVLSQLLNDINPSLENYERIKMAVIMKHDWTIANGLMTATLKVKRNEIEKIYVPRYKQWYDCHQTVLWEP